MTTPAGGSQILYPMVITGVYVIHLGRDVCAAREPAQELIPAEDEHPAVLPIPGKPVSTVAGRPSTTHA